MDIKAIEKDIYSIFADVASKIGYSEIHGSIIAALLVNRKELSLDQLSKKTGYSASAISVSLDLLELLGMVKKMRKTGDRKLYVKLEGNLLEGLKKAFLFRIKKSVSDNIEKFELLKNKAKKAKNNKIIKTIEILEDEIKKIDEYLDLLSNL